MTAAHLHLVIGPVGAGKSTFAHQLAHERRAALLILDDWMARLYGADERPATGRVAWYIERRDRCLAQIWDQTLQLSRLAVPVVLEIGLIQRHDRATFYRWVDDEELPLSVYLLDLDRDTRRARVMRRNEQQATFSRFVPLEFFELASDMWQPPDDEELLARQIQPTQSRPPQKNTPP